MSDFEQHSPIPEPVEYGNQLTGSTPETGADGAIVRSDATAGADGDLPDQTAESARTTAGPSEN